jgi:uroporphyrinogen-III synthase
MARQSRLECPIFPAQAIGAIPVLLTRPAPQSRRFAAQLGRRFGPRVAPLIAPLMLTQFLEAKLPDGPMAGLIFTSQTAVEAATRNSARLAAAGAGAALRAYCVGARTAEAARAAGFEAVSAAGDADALVDLILRDRQGFSGPISQGLAAGRAPLWHLHGEEIRGDVASQLRSAGINVCSAILYRQVPQALSDAAQALLTAGAPVIVPLFSPRSAALFSQNLPKDRAPLWVVAISQATADALGGLVPEGVRIALSPEAPAMLDAMAVWLGDDPRKDDAMT